MTPRLLSDTATHELRRNWKVLAGATLGMAVGVHALPFYTAGLFMAALNAEFGWTRAEMSLGPTFLVIGLALASPILGMLSDRFGERRLIIAGLAILTVALVMLSKIGGRIEQYYFLMALMAFCASGTATPTYSRIVSRGFDEARGTAIGIAMTGTALATIVAPPMLEHILTVEGWRAGYLAMAIITGVSAPIIILLLRHDTAAHSAPGTDTRSDFRVVDFLRGQTFWTLAASLFAVAIAAPGLIVHFIPFLTDQGVSRFEAAGYASLIGGVLLVARLGTGILVDRLPAHHVAAAIMAISAFGFIGLAYGGVRFAAVGALAAGISFGAEGNLIGYMTARYFNPQAFGRIFGLLYAAYLAGTAISPTLYGVAFDHFGSYEVILIAAAVTLLLSAALFIRLGSVSRRSA